MDKDKELLFVDKPVSPSDLLPRRRPVFEKTTDLNHNVLDSIRFQNGEAVYNQVLDMCYTVDEIVEVLNSLSDFEDRTKITLQKLYNLTFTMTMDDKLDKNDLRRLVKIMANDIGFDLTLEEFYKRIHQKKEKDKSVDR